MSENTTGNSKRLARWRSMSDDALAGADYTIRVLHTSPVFRKAAIEVIESLWREVDSVREERKRGAQA